MTIKRAVTIKELDKPAMLRLEVGDAAEAGFTTEISVDGGEGFHLPPDTPLALCRQTHSLNIAVVDSAEQYPLDTDALITSVPGIAVGVRTADCVPIVISAPDIGAVAAVHAGWRGTLGGIVSLTIRRLVAMGSDPAKMHAAVGPGICQRCYEVDFDLGERFRQAGLGEFVSTDNGAGCKPHLDLKGINRHLLLNAGLPTGNVTISDVCPYHTMRDGIPILPSYRRDRGTEERLVTMIMLRR